MIWSLMTVVVEANRRIYSMLSLPHVWIFLERVSSVCSALCGERDAAKPSDVVGVCPSACCCASCCVGWMFTAVAFAADELLLFVLLMDSNSDTPHFSFCYHEDALLLLVSSHSHTWSSWNGKRRLLLPRPSIVLSICSATKHQEPSVRVLHAWREIELEKRCRQERRDQQSSRSSQPSDPLCSSE